MPFGADFYGLERNAGTVKLERGEWEVPAAYGFAGEDVEPLGAGQVMKWKLGE